MEGYKRRLATLERGLAGCHGEYAGKDRCSVSIPDRRIRAYYGELVEGGYVIDKGEALESNPSLAVVAPMCDGTLAPGTRDKFRGADDSMVAHALAAEPENGYCGLARLMLAAPDCGAFDYVAPDVFAAWWAAHGARIGVRVGDTIDWGNGQLEPIPDFGRRYEE